MSSNATLDPTLTRLVSDTPSLIASSTVKKKRTRKKLLTQVRTPSPPEHNAILHSDQLYLCMILDQNTTTNVITDSANASSTGKVFTILFFNHFLHWHSPPTC
jgi:hypothetical protein